MVRQALCASAKSGRGALGFLSALRALGGVVIAFKFVFPFRFAVNAPLQDATGFRVCAEEVGGVLLRKVHSVSRDKGAPLGLVGGRLVTKSLIGQ